MPKFIGEFETIFGQLERMGQNTKVRESHNAPLFLASLGTNSQLESIVAALHSRKVDSLTWKSVTADLIQEWAHTKKGKGNESEQT